MVEVSNFERFRSWVVVAGGFDNQFSGESVFFADHVSSEDFAIDGNRELQDAVDRLLLYCVSVPLSDCTRDVVFDFVEFIVVLKTLLYHVLF